MSQDGLFSDLRVLDLSRGIGGAYATKLLADQGADVLKVEERERPDPLRRETACGVAPAEGEDSALFRFLNAGKRSVAFSDRAALLELAEESDVLVESFEPGDPAGLLGDPADLRRRLPRLSTVAISPWGRTGPYADRPATEWTLQAGSGFMARRGRPEMGHIGAGGRLGEYSAGAFAAVAALASWREARRSGQGRSVDISMFESMLICSTQYWDLDSQMRGGQLPQYLDIPAVEPAKDGWVGFSPQTSDQWKSFCLLIERPEIAEDDRFLTADIRQAHLDFLHDAIHSWTRQRTIEEILELCEALRIPASPVGNGELLPETDHFVARGVFVDNPHGFTQPRTPYALSACERRPVRPAPSLGADDAAWRPRAESTPAAADAGAGQGALAGLRVADLTAFWAGPFATNVMALLGADVVKVESIGHPDGMRFVNAKPGVPIWEGGCIFHGANPEKRGTTLELNTDEGRAVLRRLVERSDLLVENFSPRVLANFGIGPETLLEWNPRLIVVRMPAWGLDGPWQNRTGFAMNVEQASGIAWRAGYTSQPLTANFCDPVGSLHAIVATFAALEHRERTGEGQVIEVPLVGPALNLAAEQIVEHSAYGARLDSHGNRNPRHVPQGIYPGGDGRYFTLAVRSEAEWSALGRVLAAGEEAECFGDPGLESAGARWDRHDEIDAAIERAAAARPAEEWVAALCEAGVPAETLINGFDLMPHPQLIARAFHQELSHPLTGTNRYSGLPFVGLADGLPTIPPPTLGQHNREVLEGELGLSGSEVDALEEKGVIGTQPPWAQGADDA